jgi:hypothetical protein
MWLDGLNDSQGWIVTSGNDFDEELARRFGLSEEVSSEQMAADTVAQERRATAQGAEETRRRAEARGGEVESDWEGSRGARELAARTLAEAHAPTKQFVIRRHLATKRKLFGKDESFWVVDEAVDGWLVKNGEEHPTLAEAEVRDALYAGGEPMVWKSTYLLTDSNIAVTFVDATKYQDHDVSLRYHHFDKGMPSDMLVPRDMRLISSAADLVRFVQAAPTYRLPDEDYFIGAAEKAARGPR